MVEGAKIKTKEYKNAKMSRDNPSYHISHTMTVALRSPMCEDIDLAHEDDLLA